VSESKQVGFVPLPRVGGALSHTVGSVATYDGTVKLGMVLSNLRVLENRRNTLRSFTSVAQDWRHIKRILVSGELGRRDSNPDKQIQSLRSYRWTTSQKVNTINYLPKFTTFAVSACCEICCDSVPSLGKSLIACCL